MSKRSSRGKYWFIGLLLCGGAAVLLPRLLRDKPSLSPGDSLIWPPLGEVVHTHKDVPIYSNGLVVYKSHGKHFSKDGYYYGRKWQCVEFIKRYYHDTHGHKMPSVWGHAKGFFNTTIPHGSRNPDRGMVQYDNGGLEKPQAEDLLVWNHEPYGHVAVISEVHDDHIVIVQQNIMYHPTQKIRLTRNGRGWTIEDKQQPAGWLRLP